MTLDPATDLSANRCDPRTKILLLIAALGLLQCFNHVALAATLLAGLLAASLALGVGPVLRRALPIILISMLISALTWAVHLEGPTLLWSWGSLRLSRESLSFGTALGLRLGAMMVASLIFLALTRVDEMHAGMVMLRLPKQLAFVVSLSLVFLPMYLALTASILDVRTARGADVRSGPLLARLRTYAGIAVPLFLHVARQTLVRAIALESRGFSMHRKRSMYHDYQIQPRDWLALAGAALLVAIAVALRVRGIGYTPMR